MTHNSARLAVLFSSALGGTVYVTSKIVLSEVGPFSLIASRFILSGIILSGVCAATATKISKEMLRESILPSLALSGALLLLFFGLLTATSSVAAFLANSDAMFIPIVGWILFGRKIGKETFQALAVGCAGLLLLTLRPGLRLANEDLLILCSALCYALYFSLNQTAVTRHSPLGLTTISQLVCGFVSLPFALALENFPHNVSGASTPALLLILYFSLVISAFRYSLLMRIQKDLTAAELGIGFLFEPVCGAALGVAVAGDHLRVIQWFGAGLILAAISWPFIAAGRKSKNKLNNKLSSAGSA